MRIDRPSSLFDLNQNIPQVSKSGYVGNGCRITEGRGKTPNEGRVVVTYEGIPGSVCSLSFYDTAASVLCKSLGLGYNGGTVIRNKFGSGSGRMYLGDIRCKGNENSILACESAGWRPESFGYGACHDAKLLHSEWEIAAVRCIKNATISNGKVTNTSRYGNPKLFVNGEWRYICRDGFDDNDARVICRDLSYPYGKALPKNMLVPIYSSKYFFINNLQCSGSEPSATKCRYSNVRTCSGDSWGKLNNIAGITCSMTPFLNGYAISLRNVFSSGASVYGTVQIRWLNINGSTCHDTWNDRAANVTCKQLGYLSGRAIYVPDYSYGPFTVGHVKCSGFESSLAGCVIRDGNCSDRRAAGVLCTSDAAGIKFRIAGGMGNYGRAEILINGQWGTVCDPDRANTSAKVFCRSLGYMDGIVYNGKLGTSSGPVAVQAPRCTGNESSILMCTVYQWQAAKYSGCRTHDNDLNVHCVSSVRLQNNGAIGPVLLNYGGKWGYACDKNWDDREAMITCRSISPVYSAAKAICCSAFKNSDPRERYEIIASNIECSGSESNFSQCRVNYGNQMACPNRQYASVLCLVIPPIDVIRVSVALSSVVITMKDGLVKLNIYGHSGRICADGWDNKDAKALCNSMGHNNAIAYRTRVSVTGSPFWVGNLTCTGTERDLKYCDGIRNRNRYGYACSSTDSAAALCYTSTTNKLSYKLISGRTTSDGTIQVTLNGRQGMICGENWTDTEANVFCKQLNFETGNAVIYSLANRPFRRVFLWLREVHCNGDELGIENCRHIGWGKVANTFCNPSSYRYKVAGVRCYRAVRLGLYVQSNFGRLDIIKNNTWYPVCDHGFTDVEARIACKQLGYVDGKAILRSFFLRKSNNQLASVKCLGNESKLNLCSIKVDSCSSKNYTSIYCVSTPIIRTQPLIVQWFNDTRRLKARVGGVWGRICPINWSDREATVFCKQKGYAGGYAFQESTASRQLPYTMANVRCKGSESNLAECIFDDPMKVASPCHFGTYDAGALCYRYSNLTIRLIGGASPNIGTVQLTFDGVPGSICDRSWSYFDAKVLCRQLGYSDGRALSRSYHGRVNGVAFLNNMRCNSREDNILQCQNSGWKKSTSRCYPTTQAGVACAGKVKIYKGNSRSYGIVNVWGKFPERDFSSWMSVCDEGWDDTDARVFCKELGYSYGKSVCCGAFGYNYRPANMTNVRCVGNEKTIFDCPHESPTFRDRCSTRNYASVVCSNSPPSTGYGIRIEGSMRFGKLGLKYYDVWGRICADGWSDADASVACRQLGFQNGQAYTHYQTSSVYGPYWSGNFKCTAGDISLGSCTRTAWGSLTSCPSGHAAGVLCYQRNGLSYRLAGSGSRNFGRVEVSVDGVWGTVCNINWRNADAGVFCRQMGFTDGILLQDSSPGNTNVVYTNDIYCVGNESRFQDCPQTSWRQSKYSDCQNHERDVAVHCFGAVRLANHTRDVNWTSGPVQIYRNTTWHTVCDVNFTDAVARQVCHELGYYDGRAVCCSGYGFFEYKYNRTLTLLWNSSNPLIENSKTLGYCSSRKYASVICIPTISVHTDYKFELETTTKPGIGRVLVKHLGQLGRVCSSNWDDNDANVFCKQINFQRGIAYMHSFHYSWKIIYNSEPYLVANVSCVGTETSLDKCKFDDRLSLGNCSNLDHYDAGVLCYNGGGIQYRLANGTNSRGRVEVGISGVWGTVCGLHWDKKDAAVFCRSLGRSFMDGDPVYNSKIFGRGQGPIWLSHLQCNGTEPSLEKCPHPGFNSSFDHFSYYQTCSHYYDAGVHCYTDVRLSTGLRLGYGTVEVNVDGTWSHVCSNSNWDDNDAVVVCKQLGYQTGKAVPRSAFGGKKLPIGLIAVSCLGTETSFKSCSVVKGSTCSSGTVAGVYCSKTPITSNGFRLRISEDRYASHYHGILEVNNFGVWGRVCPYGFGDREASAACKTMKYAGGVAYTHIALNKRPIVVSNVSCPLGFKLESCSFTNWGDNYTCHATGFEAGVICYNTTAGMNYRIVGPKSNYGRVEISYDGLWGTICDQYWSYFDALVLCKQFNYKDGIAVRGSAYGGGNGPVWVKSFGCIGSEKTILQCFNTGWNESITSSCKSHNYDASVKCFNEKIRITKVRLADGNSTSGRVEVYATGVNQWGTVCDDMWDDKDAKVVCKMLGFPWGKAIRNNFGIASGMIMLDNVQCAGNESNVGDCQRRGFLDHNCDHSEDASVACFAMVPTTTIESSEATSKLTSTVIMKTSEQLTTTTAGWGQQGRRNVKPVAIAVPVVLFVIIALVVVGAVVIYKYRKSHPPLTSNPSVTRDSPMQVSNILYDLALAEQQEANNVNNRPDGGPPAEPIYSEPQPPGPSVTTPDTSNLVKYEEVPENPQPEHVYANPSAHSFA
ncbi:scavenger receptor cysteine-rich type 1 protein M160-like isoform X2 [Tubulanus polymorphus]|uniref:scavenger receptor cysteine-rich type 1 protein M160-like isoform X2 n=1 Tax=Tubulanus polymorphus TaxID=672921 RepID=UPI003DA21211